MESELVHIDYSIVMIYFLFYMLFFSVIGLVVFILMRRPSARRDLFADLPAASLATSLIVALLAALPGIIYAYFNSWSRFYKISMEGEALNLTYIYPERMQTIDITDGLAFGKSTHTSRGGVMYRIKITDSKGNAYRSIPTHKRAAEEYVSKLKAVTTR